MRVSQVADESTAPEGMHRIVVTVFMATGLGSFGFACRSYDLDQPVPSWTHIQAARRDLAKTNGLPLDQIGFVSWAPLA